MSFQVGHDDVLLTTVRAPSGAGVGRIAEERAGRVFARPVGPKHVYRELDAYSIGEHVLAQLRRWRVEHLRYETDTGDYTITLREFIGHAVIREFPGVDRQHVCARRFWTFTPRAEAGRSVVPARQPVEQLALAF